MSPRAAWRLEQLGFGAVYDYAAGKVDWIAAGLPTVHADRPERRALDVVDRHPPTCRSDDVIEAEADGRTVIVINDQGIVLGRIRPAARSRAPARADELMEIGPATVRAHEPLAPLLERMARRKVSEVIVTTPEGRLLGVVRGEEART